MVQHGLTWFNHISPGLVGELVGLAGSSPWGVKILAEGITDFRRFSRLYKHHI